MTVDSLRSRTRKELAQLAKCHRVGGWHGMKKEELIAALLAHFRKRPAKNAKSIGAAKNAGTTSTRDRRRSGAHDEVSAAGWTAAVWLPRRLRRPPDRPPHRRPHRHQLVKGTRAPAAPAPGPASRSPRAGSGPRDAFPLRDLHIWRSMAGRRPGADLPWSKPRRRRLSQPPGPKENRDGVRQSAGC